MTTEERGGYKEGEPDTSASEGIGRKAAAGGMVQSWRRFGTLKILPYNFVLAGRIK